MQMHKQGLFIYNTSLLPVSLFHTVLTTSAFVSHKTYCLFNYNSSLSLPTCAQAIMLLDVLYTVLRSSPQALSVLLEWGVEQLYCLLLKPGFGDDAHERVFRVSTSSPLPPLASVVVYPASVYPKPYTDSPCCSAGHVQSPKERTSPRAQQTADQAARAHLPGPGLLPGGSPSHNDNHPLPVRAGSGYR